MYHTNGNVSNRENGVVSMDLSVPPSQILFKCKCSVTQRVDVQLIKEIRRGSKDPQCLWQVSQSVT